MADLNFTALKNTASQFLAKRSQRELGFIGALAIFGLDLLRSMYSSWYNGKAKKIAAGFYDIAEDDRNAIADYSEKPVFGSDDRIIKERECNKQIAALQKHFDQNRGFINYSAHSLSHTLPYRLLQLSGISSSWINHRAQAYKDPYWNAPRWQAPKEESIPKLNYKG